MSTHISINKFYINNIGSKLYLSFQVYHCTEKGDNLTEHIALTFFYQKYLGKTTYRQSKSGKNVLWIKNKTN